MSRKTIWLLSWEVLFLFCSSNLWADTAGQLFSFGDSGIDNGNVFAVTEGLEPASPYWEGRFTNGLNYLDILAGAVSGWEATPWYYGGTNAAFGGAQTGLGYAPEIEVLNVGQQVLEFQAEYAQSYTSSDMILFSMGQNDLLFNGDDLPEPSLVAENMIQAILIAYEHGARRFIFPTLFPLYLMPEVVSDSLSAAETAEAWVNEVNALADTLIAQFKTDYPDVIIIRTDFTDRISDVYANPGKYGITNVTESAYTGDFYGEGGSVVQDADTYLWWDGAHVTATIQELIAKWVLLDVQDALFPGQSSPQAALGSILTLLDQAVLRNQWESARVFTLLAPQRSFRHQARNRDPSVTWHLTPFGVAGSQDGDSLSSGWSWYHTGLVLTREKQLPGGALGVSLIASKGKLDLDNGYGETDIRLYQAGVYGGITMAPCYLSLGGRYGYADNQALRESTLTETTAVSRFHTHLFSGWMEAGIHLRTPVVTLSPLAGLAYVRMINGTGDETGGGLLGYDTVDYLSTHHIGHQLGIRARQALADHESFRGEWSAMAAWRHEYLDTRAASSVSHGGETYDFASPSRLRDSLCLAAGIRLSAKKGPTLSLDYQGNWAKDALTHSFNFSLALAF